MKNKLSNPVLKDTAKNTEKILNFIVARSGLKHLLVLVVVSGFCTSGYAQNTKEVLFDQSSVKITEISTNTKRSDFGPSIIGDSIYFSSFRDEVIGKSDQKFIAREFYDLYRAGIDDSGNVVGPRHAVDEFITRFHDGPVSWCAQTGELFITQSNFTDPQIRYNPFKNENIKLRIVIARHTGGKWNITEEFPYNNAAWSVGHPAINPTGDTLYFTSDMAGGFGETDIYRSVRKNNQWGTPVNLGAQVNTAGKDEFPFVTGNNFPERVLIFASTGHQSKGGFDLFYKRMSDLNPDISQFGEPINSTADDFGMTLPSKGDFGYLTSNRPGTGNDDIYKLTFDRGIEYLHEIFVRDAKSLNPIPGALINFCGKKSEFTGQNGLVSFPFLKNSTCDIQASALGYKDNHMVVTNGMPKAGSPRRDTISLDMNVNQKIVLKNIYYDFDKWDILPESARELDRLVAFTKENPEIKVELTSHTDERGSEKYNLKLSQLRAQAAVDYVVSKGIEKSTVTGKGMGETQLINKSSPGFGLTPVQHRENRRTEIFIPGLLSSEPVKQEAGDYLSGKPDHTSGYSSLKAHGSIYGKSLTAAPGSTTQKEYCLILGSFINKTYALKFYDVLKAAGLDAAMINDNDPFRVGIRYNSYTEAKKSLDYLSSTYIGWIVEM